MSTRLGRSHDALVPVMPSLTTTSSMPASNALISILPPEKVDATALGLADIWELIAQVRELAKKFQDGAITRDEVGDGVKLVLALFGLKEEGELAEIGRAHV